MLRCWRWCNRWIGRELHHEDRQSQQHVQRRESQAVQFQGQRGDSQCRQDGAGQLDQRYGHITNSGDVAGTFTLTKSKLADSAGPNGGVLSGKLDLKIEDVTSPGSPVAVYSGKVDAMGAQQLGKYNAGEARTYKFTVAFPDGGTPASATTGDNAFKASSLSVDYEWDSVS